MARMFFNEIEAAKIAQNMERDGIEFYQRAAAKAKTEGTRKVLARLSEDEKKHLARFEELEETLQARRAGAAAYTDEAEIAAYIDRLLDTQVFRKEGDVARLVEEAESDCEALAVGMRAERDAIVFYQEMLDFTDSRAAKEAFGQILLEEREHLKTLGERSDQCENHTA
jgi:rubrerythrin